jgi:signal transduction histidine kinase/DNA-binding response OmpR family regulator
MNLPPGTYTFMVKGSNDDLKWNESPTSMRIKILPPPWRTWWAYAIYSIIIALTVFLYRRYTIQRERERNKTKMDEMKLSFFINISHELRTPLTLITGPLERIIQKEEDSQKKDKLSLVFRNASRLQQLVNQLLDIRKLELGKLKPVIYQSDFKQYLDVILESFKTYAEDNRMHLNTSLELNENNIWFDPDILEKVLSNLLINAFKYTSRDGDVWITARDYAQRESQQVFQKLSKTMHQVKSNQKLLPNVRYISLEIADSGEGLEPSDLEKIFNRFYQNNAFKRHSSISSGIGLSLVKDLVDRIHGFIFVQSEVGLGTRFLLFLPVERKAFPNAHIHEHDDEIEFYSKDYSNVLTTEPILRNKEPENIENRSDKRKKASILIVDDNEELLDYIGDILSESYHIKTAPDGEAGIKKAINNKIDLIISDIMMPVMDGLEFCNKIKNDIRTSHIPVVLLTAKKTIESELEGLDTGADDYITKPFHPNLLLKRVRNIIASREKIWEKIASDTHIIPQGLELTTKEEDFLEKAIQIIEENLSDSDFNQEIFCREIGMSKASLYRKINSLTNQSINEFVRNVRLKKAAEILRCGKQIHIAELAYRVGFSEPSYFTKKYREFFGLTPKEYNNRYIKSEQEGTKVGLND